MAVPNTGKNIGRVSIKVLPDTKDFRERLERDLKRVNDKGWAVNFDKANVDRQKIRADIERQMKGLGTARTQVDVVPHVDNVKLDRQAVRRSIDRQLKGMAWSIGVFPHLKGEQDFHQEVKRMLRNAEDTDLHFKPEEVKIKPEIDRSALEKVRDELYALFGDEENGKKVIDFATHLDEESKLNFEHKLNELIRKYDGKELKINAALNSLIARTRLAVFLRDRFLDIHVRISKASLAKAAKELATLAASASGLRLLGDWIDDLTNAFRNLDRNAPMIIGITSLVASAISAVMAAGQGIIGIAGDVAKIGPALLVLPGLILNAIASFVVIGIAMKDAKKELASLADDMTDLGRIISETFWDKARDPIVNMANTLLPQLRNALRDTADATGGFVGKMAEAFEKHLGNGRLEKIFDGINASWDILADGADGFAGAIVNLSEIGARYMPGLAQWFSDLAGRFDAWLTKISTSDQLDTWISNAVDEMNELWRATKNAWGFLGNLYEAANKAGGTGLTGLADVLGAWDEITSTKEFQDGLVAIFNGSSDAMDAFAEAIKAVGQLIGDNADAFEDLLSSAGGFAGGLIEAIADALNSPRVIGGMNDFSEGLTKGLEKIAPQLQPIADTFGSFLSLLGTVAESTLPSVVEALGNLTPALDAIIGPIQDALPNLGDALVSVTEALGPAAADIAGALSSATVSAISALADALELLGPVLTPLADALAKVVGALEIIINKLVNSIETLGSNLATAYDRDVFNQAVELGLDKFALQGEKVTLDLVADVNLLVGELGLSAKEQLDLARDLINPSYEADFRAAADKAAKAFVSKYEDALQNGGQSSADALVQGIENSDLPEQVKKAIGWALEDAGYEYDYFEQFGERAAEQLDVSPLNAAVETMYEQFRQAAESGGLEGAQALWDSFDDATQDSDWAQQVLQMMRDFGYDIEDVMGEGGFKAAGAFGEGMDGEIKPALNGVGSTMLNSLEQAFAGVKLATGESGLAAATALGQGLTSGTPGVQQAIAALKQAGLVDPMADLESLMSVPGGDAVLGLIAGLQSGTVGVAGATGELRDAGIVDQFNMLSAVMPGVGADTIVGLIDGINSQSGALAGASGAVKQSGIADQFKAMSSLLPNAGAETILGLIQGLESKGISVGTTAESIKKSGILDKFVGANGFLTAEGKQIVDGLTSGINSGKTGVGTATDGVKQAGIVDKFNGAGNMLVGPGGAIIKGLSAGITAGKAATGTATEGVRKAGILDWFMNPERMLSDQGSRLTRGLADSIKGAQYFVRNASQNLRSDGVMAPFAGIDTRFGDIGSTIPSRLANAMRGGAYDVSNASNRLRSDGVIDPFSGIETKVGQIGVGIPNSLAAAIRGGQTTVGSAAEGLRANSVMGKFAGIDQRFSTIGGDIGSRLSGGLYAAYGVVSRAASALRADAIMGKFAGIEARFYTIGLNSALQLSWGLHGGGNAIGSASAALRGLAESNLSRLTGAANGIGASVYATITYWVNQSIGQLSRLSAAASTAQANAANAVSSISSAAPSSLTSLQTISAGISTQSSLMATTAATTASYVPAPLSTDTGYNRAAQAPANVNVTMPLLPGETPGEQRDNVVRELRNVFGN